MTSGLRECRPWKDILRKKNKIAQTQTEESRAEFVTSLHCGMEEEQPKVIRIPTLIYPATVQQQPPDNKHSQGYAEVNWNPVNMLDLELRKS